MIEEEIPKHKRKKGKKHFKIEVQYKSVFFSDTWGWCRMGAYSKKSDAEKALEKFRKEPDSYTALRLLHKGKVVSEEEL